MLAQTSEILHVSKSRRLKRALPAADVSTKAKRGKLFTLRMPPRPFGSLNLSGNRSPRAPTSKCFLMASQKCLWSPRTPEAPGVPRPPRIFGVPGILGSLRAPRIPEAPEITRFPGVPGAFGASDFRSPKCSRSVQLSPGPRNLRGSGASGGWRW